jgi:hypothetical protein
LPDGSSTTPASSRRVAERPVALVVEERVRACTVLGTVGEEHVEPAIPVVVEQHALMSPTDVSGGAAPRRDVFEPAALVAVGEAPPVHGHEQIREAVAVEVAAERGAVLAQVSEPERRGTLLEGAVRALQVDEVVAGVHERALDARRRHRDVDVGSPVPSKSLRFTPSERP